MESRIAFFPIELTKFPRSTGFKKSTSCRNLSGFSKRVRSNCYIRPEIKVLHQILKIWQRGDKNMLKILQKGWQTTSKRGDKHIKKTTSKRGDKKKSAEKKSDVKKREQALLTLKNTFEVIGLLQSNLFWLKISVN